MSKWGCRAAKREREGHKYKKRVRQSDCRFLKVRRGQEFSCLRLARMTMLRKLVQNCRTLASAAANSWVPSYAPRHMLRSSSHLPSILLANASDEQSRSASQALQNAAFFLAFGCGLSFAVSGLSQPAMTEADPVDNKVESSSKEKNLDMENIMQQAEKGIQERIKGIQENTKALNLPASAFSQFTVSAKGQQVSIKFPVSPLCDLWHLVVDVISHVGKLHNDINQGKIIVSASDSVVAQVMTLEHPDYQIQKLISEKSTEEPASSSNALCIGIFEPLIGGKLPEIEFLKKGYYSEEELDLVVNTLRISSMANPRKGPRHFSKKEQESRQKSGSNKSALDSLEAMGVKVYGSESWSGQLDQEVVSWDNIAGYLEQKREIEDTVLLALRCPEIYDSIARGTRRKFESNRPRAVLFEGPPGTGKTSSARVIANQAGVPLLYVPLEAVMSKYYGESERMLGKVFNTANNLQNGAIIFLDEIDSLATTRDSEMHEATRRMLSVLLRQIDGFEQDNRVVVIAATNRKEDLDPALISRFDSSIQFDLPDQRTREEITAQYACHLTPTELTAVAVASEGMSGRDLRDICQQAERRWASKVIRNHANSPMAYGLPPLEEYMECAKKRRIALQVSPSERDRRARFGKWPPSVVV